MAQTDSLTKTLAGMPNGVGKLYVPAIHPSSATLPSCPRYFLFAARLGWSIPEFAESLSAGHVMHQVMLAVRKGSSLPAACKAIYQANELALRELEEEYRQEFPTGKLPSTFDKSYKAMSLGVMLANIWCEHYPLPPTWKVLVAEKTAEMDLEAFNIDATIKGTIDAVLLDDKDQVWIEDHKSTSYDAAVRATGLAFDTQTLLYRALWDHIQNMPEATGTIHNIIKKPSIRQKTKSGETYEEYLDRCREWYESEFVANPKRPPMARSFVRFVRPPIEEDRELQRRLRDIAEFRKRTPTLSNYWRIGSAFHGCVNRGRACKYMPFCEVENPSLWYGIYQRENFRKRPPR